MARGFKDEDEPGNIQDPDLWDKFDRDDFSPGDRRGNWRGKRKPDEGFSVPNVEVVAETGAAICVRGKGLSTDPFGMQDENDEQWFPLSQIHTKCEIRHKGDKGTLVISTWLAEKKGLV